MAPTDSPHPIRIAVAGLGKMGIMHTAMIRAIPGAEVAALVDLDKNLGRQVRSMGADAPWFSSIESCLAEARPDGVVVSTPQFTHRAVSEACLRAGVAVMTEKPLAHTLADARAMLSCAAEHPNVPAGVGLMLGHNPLFERARLAVSGGVLGEVKAVRASCCLSQVFAPSKGWTFTKDKAGGGVLINSGSHLLYVLLKVMGPVRGLTARGSGVHNAVEDTLGAVIDFESGAWGTLEVTWSVPGYEFQTHDLRIEGTRGALEVGNETFRLWLTESHGDYAKGWTELRRDEIEPRAAFSLSPDYCGDEFYLENLDFVEAIRDGRQPKVGWGEGYEVQRVIDAIYRSAESKAYVEMKDDDAANS